MAYKLPKKPLKQPLFMGGEWSVSRIELGWEIIQELAKKYKWGGYPVQFEIVSAEQMLDNYSSIGMPTMYSHWSFGKDFIKNRSDYLKGKTTLAYELVINTNPSICYIMEDNTQMMQLLVTAHAAIGHNHFFKNNYLFKEWTDPSSIVEYMKYAKKYISTCEEKYGVKNVEEVLDACHALETHAIYKYKRKYIKKDAKEAKETDRLQHIYNSYSKEIFGSFSDYKAKKLSSYRNINPEENLLMFIAEHSPKLEDWQREILRIKCNIAQYFYPQMQDKMLNEGFASFVHYTLMHDLYAYGFIDEGYMLEFFENHSAVLYQPNFNKDRPGTMRINPYYVGFHLFKEIKRVCENPTQEDLDFCPQICNTNWIDTVNFVVENYKDETAILDFLTPNLIRKFKLFNVSTDEKKNHYLVTNTHTNNDHKEIRKKLAAQFSLANYIPDIEVKINNDYLTIIFKTSLDNPIDKEQFKFILDYIRFLWGHKVDCLQKTETALIDINRDILWAK